MLFQKIKAYKWQALASLVMTGLMVTSSLLQPRYLQEVLEALLTGDNEAIYTIGFWLILVALIGLVAGGINVVLAATLLKEFRLTYAKMPFARFKLFHMLILRSLMQETLSFV